MELFLGYITSLLFFLLSQALQSRRLKEEITALKKLLDDHKPLG